jgi:hypothetical protein
MDSQSRFEISAVSYSYKFQQCHWHRWNFTPYCHSHFCGINDNGEMAMTIMPRVSAVSLTPCKQFQRCHWHQWNSNIIDYFGEYEAICKTCSLVISRVSTEFRQHGIPYIFVTSVYSVCHTELPKIPRNYTEFRVTECSRIPRNSAEFALHGISHDWVLLL